MPSTCDVSADFLGRPLRRAKPRVPHRSRSERIATEIAAHHSTAAIVGRLVHDDGLSHWAALNRYREALLAMHKDGMAISTERVGEVILYCRKLNRSPQLALRVKLAAGRLADTAMACRTHASHQALPPSSACDRVVAQAICVVLAEELAKRLTFPSDIRHNSPSARSC